ncbi:hypothetical protein TM49_01470 [Martelella endophytica]|uniref:Uncharacterized protein n=1 Tax=Martelella endophytica TaxID=1486262 RepID=A0A0D5LKH3_MAREN|nr:hypothetical protein TM49_01470 [Martelella endophytica]
MPPGTGYRTLQDAADNHQILQVWCGGCRRRVNYLPADLVPIVGWQHYAHEPPFACSRCKTKEYMATALLSPSLGDYGDIKVRRPAGMVRVWKTVNLGDDP